MFIDNELKWQDDTVASGTSLYALDNSTNSAGLAGAVDGSINVYADDLQPGIGRPLYVVVNVTTDFGGTATGVSFELVSSSVEAIGSGTKTVLASSGDLGAATAIDAGERYVFPIDLTAVPDGAQWLQFRHTVTGGVTNAGAYEAAIVTDYDVNAGNPATVTV